MNGFGWGRLGYLAVTLVVLAVIVRLGALGAQAIPDVVNSSERSLTSMSETTDAEEPANEIPLEIPDVSGVSDSADSPSTGIPEQSVGDPEHHEGHEEHSGHDHESAATSIYRNVDFEKEAPVFYRPAPAKGFSGARSAPSPGDTTPGTSGSSRGGSGEKMCRNVSAAPDGAKIVFPLTDEYFDSYDDTWGAARPQGGHEGTDLMTPDGVPEFAITDGTVTTVSGANGNGWNELGGYTVMVRADYSIGPVKEGDLFYYAHLNQPTKLDPGDRVSAGDVVGYSGDTGQGPEVTSGQFPPHLHLGWYDVSSGRSQLASGAMNPYPLLEWIKANGGSIEGGSDIPYCEGVQPSVPVPSDGGSWQFPSDPGQRPDMDTGTDNATPTPDATPLTSAESSPNVTKEEVREPRPRPLDPDELRDELRDEIREDVGGQVDETIEDAEAPETGNPDNEDSSGGNKPDGNKPDGNKPDGNKPDGNKPEADETDTADNVEAGEGGDRPNSGEIRKRIEKIREDIENRIRKQLRQINTPERPDIPETTGDTSPETSVTEPDDPDGSAKDRVCSRGDHDTRGDGGKDRSERQREAVRDCKKPAKNDPAQKDDDTSPSNGSEETSAPDEPASEKPDEDGAEPSDEETNEGSEDSDNSDDSDDPEVTPDPTGQYTEPDAIEATQVGGESTDGS